MLKYDLNYTSLIFPTVYLPIKGLAIILKQCFTKWAWSLRELYKRLTGDRRIINKIILLCYLCTNEMFFITKTKICSEIKGKLRRATQWVARVDGYYRIMHEFCNGSHGV